MIVEAQTTVFGRKGARSSNVWDVVIFHLNKSDERIPNFVGRCYRCYGPCTDIHDIRCDVATEPQFIGVQNAHSIQTFPEKYLQ